MGGGSPLQPEAPEVEQRGKEGRERAEHEQAKRASSYRAAGSRTTEKTQGFAKTKDGLGVDWVR